ncbi:hypothetical protein Tco_0508415 [Tanacetum coccineum]
MERFLCDDVGEKVRNEVGEYIVGDDAIVILSDKVEGSGDWNSPEYQDTAVSKGKKVMNALSFYRMETNEISERYIAPCFMNGLEAFDGEVNLAFDKNLISNKFAVKLCLEYKVKKGKKLVKKELIVALKGELYFVKFIINPEEDDFEPGVILGRSFLRPTQGVVDFGNGVIIIYPEPDLFEEEFEKTGKSLDYQLLDFNFDDVPKFGEELPPFVCKMRKSNRNKKRAMENLNLFYQDIGPSSSAGRHLTQEEVAKEELAIRISQRYALLEEERPTVKENKEAVKRIKGEALKEKDDPGAFIFPIRLEGKVNENALADTRSNINIMPYRIFEIIGREYMKEIDRGITMIDHTQAEAMGKLSNVLCQVEVTTIIVKFLILGIPIDRDAPTMVGWGFLHTIGYANVAWVITRWMKRKGAGTQKESQICCDTITLRDLIDSDGKLIPEDQQPGVPRVGILRPLRASMQDLYDRMGHMKICKDTIERIEYRQSYHWDRYHGVFEYMAGVYSVPL